MNLWGLEQQQQQLCDKEESCPSQRPTTGDLEKAVSTTKARWRGEKLHWIKFHLESTLLLDLFSYMRKWGFFLIQRIRFCQLHQSIITITILLFSSYCWNPESERHLHIYSRLPHSWVYGYLTYDSPQENVATKMKPEKWKCSSPIVKIRDLWWPSS